MMTGCRWVYILLHLAHPCLSAVLLSGWSTPVLHLHDMQQYVDSEALLSLTHNHADLNELSNEHLDTLIEVVQGSFLAYSERLEFTDHPANPVVASTSAVHGLDLLSVPSTSTYQEHAFVAIFALSSADGVASEAVWRVHDLRGGRPPFARDVDFHLTPGDLVIAPAFVTYQFLPVKGAALPTVFMLTLSALDWTTVAKYSPSQTLRIIPEDGDGEGDVEVAHVERAQHTKQFLNATDFPRAADKAWQKTELLVERGSYTRLAWISRSQLAPFESLRVAVDSFLHSRASFELAVLRQEHFDVNDFGCMAPGEESDPMAFLPDVKDGVQRPSTWRQSFVGHTRCEESDDGEGPSHCYQDVLISQRDLPFGGCVVLHCMAEVEGVAQATDCHLHAHITSRASSTLDASPEAVEEAIPAVPWLDTPVGHFQRLTELGMRPEQLQLSLVAHSDVAVPEDLAQLSDEELGALHVLLTQNMAFDWRRHTSWRTAACVMAHFSSRHLPLVPFIEFPTKSPHGVMSQLEDEHVTLMSLPQGFVGSLLHVLFTTEYADIVLAIEKMRDGTDIEFPSHLSIAAQNAAQQPRSAWSAPEGVVSDIVASLLAAVARLHAEGVAHGNVQLSSVWLRANRHSADVTVGVVFSDLRFVQLEERLSEKDWPHVQARDWHSTAQALLLILGSPPCPFLPLGVFPAADVHGVKFPASSSQKCVQWLDAEQHTELLLNPAHESIGLPSDAVLNNEDINRLLSRLFQASHEHSEQLIMSHLPSAADVVQWLEDI